MSSKAPGAVNAPAVDEPPELIRAIPLPHYGRWATVAVLVVLAAMAVHGLVTNENYHWDLVFPMLFTYEIGRAIGWTLILTVAAMTIGIILAVTLAVMRRSANPVMRAVATFYIWFFRGTPIYTQLIFWGLIGVLYPRLSLGIPFGPEFFSFRTYDVFTAGVSAILGLGLNEAAYLAEIVRSGLGSVDKGQEEAAQALGMRPRTILFRIVLPQAMRVIVPPTGNETISMLKTTSLVTAVPFTLELTKVATDYGSQTLLPIPFLVVAGIWYLVITSILMFFQSKLEAYYGRGDSTTPGRLSLRGRRRQRTSRQAAINAAHTTPAATAAEWTP
ncbi:MAG: amino acid ABC transporter permease [Propionibacteriaceae bacterium]|nr:amino acid ABC transporter permease [Propionibacteriaceae bacterium]